MPRRGKNVGLSKNKKIMKGGDFKSSELDGGDTVSSNLLLIVIILLVAVILALLFFNNKKHKRETNINSCKTNDTNNVQKIIIEKEVISTDPRAPPIYPVQDPVYPMRGYPQNYQQMGVLVSQDSAEYKPIILPLFGRRMLSKDRWLYYTASNEYNMWRIPVRVNNRDCQDEVGCDEIFNGDNVTVPDLGDKVFVARIYKYQGNLI
jgi:hypothetical protein